MWLRLRPDTVMPYMLGTTEEVEKGWLNFSLPWFNSILNQA